MAWPDVIFTDSFFIMTLYLMIGVLVYGYLESWTALDAFYFQIVAASTVGFGDFVPSSTVGRLLTCIYTPVGTVLLYRAMHPYASFFTSSIDSAARSLPGLADVPESLTAEGDANHVRHVVRALLSPLLVIGVGAAVFYRFFGYDESVVEAIYFAFTCVSTIGFGDLAPGQTKTKMAVIVYVALGSAICGVLLENTYVIEKRRQIRTTDHTKYTAELLLQASCWDAAREGEKAIHGARADGGGLSESDFLLAVLTAHELIDVPTLVALRRQFAHIMNQTATVTAGGAAKPDASAGGGSDDGSSGRGAAVQRLQEAGRRIDARVVFARYVSDGRVRQRAADAPIGTHLALPRIEPQVAYADDKIATVDLTAADGGFAEWYVQFWMKRVELARSNAPTAASAPAAGAAHVTLL